MTVDEIKEANIKNAIHWVETNHPEIEVSNKSPSFVKFMTEMGRKNDGVFGRGCALFNGVDFQYFWEKANV